MTKINDRIIDKICDKIDDFFRAAACPDVVGDREKDYYEGLVNLVNNILSTEISDRYCIAVVDREAELPDNELWHKNEREFEAFCAGRNIMLQDGFVKEIKDE